MLHLLESEWLLWGGVTVMVITVMLGIFCLVLFFLTRWRLKKKLEQEYGEPWK